MNLKQRQYLKKMIGPGSTLDLELQQLNCVEPGAKRYLLSQATNQNRKDFQMTLDKLNTILLANEVPANTRTIVLFKLKFISDLCNQAHASYSRDTVMAYHLKDLGPIKTRDVIKGVKSIVTELMRTLNEAQDWRLPKKQEQEYRTLEEQTAENQTWRSKKSKARELAILKQTQYTPQFQFSLHTVAAVEPTPVECSTSTAGESIPVSCTIGADGVRRYSREVFYAIRDSMNEELGEYYPGKEPTITEALDGIIVLPGLRS